MEAERAVQFADRMRDALGQRDARCVALQQRVDEETARRRNLEAAEAGRGGGLEATRGYATPISRVYGTPSVLPASSGMSPSFASTALPTSNFASTALPTSNFVSPSPPPTSLASSPLLARPGVGHAPAIGDVLGSGVKPRFGHKHLGTSYLPSYS